VSASKRGGTVTAASGNNAAGLVPNIGQIPNVQIPDINQIIANQQGRRLMASAVEECGNQLSKDWWVYFSVGQMGASAACSLGGCACLLRDGKPLARKARAQSSVVATKHPWSPGQ
jgi:hypothetical protein